MRYFFEDGTPDRVKATARGRMDAHVQREMVTEEVRTHMARLARGYKFVDPAVGVFGIRLPHDLIAKVTFMYGAGKRVDPTMARGYESGGVSRNTYVKELKKFLGTLNAFYAGAMDVFVLMVYSTTSTRKKKKRRLVTLYATPPTILHLPEIRASFAGAVDPGLEFHAPLSEEVKGVISSVRWAVEACGFYHTDSAQFIEIHFEPFSLYPQIRFNTGRNLARMANQPWVYRLLNQASHTVARGYFADDEPPIFVSVIFGPGHVVFTGVKLRSADAPPHTATADPVRAAAPPSKTSVSDGAAADTPGPEPDRSTPTDGSPATPDRPQAS